MNNKLSIFGIFIILTIFIIAGCSNTAPNSMSNTQSTNSQQQETTKPVTTQTNTVQQASGSSAANINTFAIVPEGEFMRVYFILEDASGQTAVSDGKYDLTIKDSVDNIVYSSVNNFKSSDFVDYQFKLTGQAMGKAYEFRVNQQDIKKGVSTGTAELTLTLSNGKQLKAEETYVSIPTYSDEELKQLVETDYQKNAKSINLVLSDKDFSITLQKSGFMNTISFDKKNVEYRIDLLVENKGTTENSVSAYNSVILDGKGNQYESAYGGTFSSGELKPGVSKTGYILFDDVPQDISIEQIQIGSDYIFDLKNSKAYTFTQMYEEEYQKNKVNYDKVLTKGNFLVEVKGFGFYKTKSYSTTDEFFRVDFFVTNTGSESEYFSPSSMALLDSNGNQYETSYGGTLDTFKNMFSHTKQEGYVLFEKVPKDISSAKLIFELGYNSNYKPYEFQYDLPILN